MSQSFLFIGNSYTHCNDLPGMVTALAASAPDPVHIKTAHVTPGGKTFEFHYSNPDTMSAFDAGDYDTVILQNHSMGPIDEPEAMVEFGTKLHDIAKAKGAEVVFYMTWPRKFALEKLPIYIKAYSDLARQLNARVAPVGPARQTVIENKPELELYTADDSHPTAIGTYVAACVFVKVLLGINPVGIAATVPAGEAELKLAQEDAELIQKAALEAVEKYQV